MRALLLLASTMLAAPVLAQTTGSCAEGTAQRFLDVSNVQASLFTNGNLFFGGSTTSGDGYLAPKTSGDSPMFAAGIWLSGRVNDQIRVSAARYGDWAFRPGPLNADGTLPNPTDCSAFDRIWVVNAAEIEVYESGQSPARDLAEWPVGLGAPTVDANGDPVEATSREQMIDLAAGERPDLLGSQTAFWVMNDVAAPRGPTEVGPLGVEVQVTAFVIAGSELAGAPDASFYRFRIINRSTNTIENARWSFFTDPDLGDASDDYVGTDTLRNMAFVYNNSNEDASYGSPPPAFGYDILSHDLAATSDFFGSNQVGAGDPSTPAEFYNTMQGLWSDGTPMTASGYGWRTEGDPTLFMYTGDPVTESFWSEVNLDGNGTDSDRGDRRLVATVAFGTLAPGDSAMVDLALLYARGSSYLDSITELRAVSDGVQTAYDSGALFQQGGTLNLLAAPALIRPENDDNQANVDTLTFEWGAVAGAEGYQIQWDASADGTFTSGQFTTEPSARIAARTLTPLSGVQTVYWRVVALASGAIGTQSEARSLTVFRGGVLTLSGGQLGYVEIANAEGTDPCGEAARSTAGCDDGYGNPVYHSFNSTNAYYFSEQGAGSETVMGVYAPNDFEIRFTEEGSLAAYMFQTPFNVIRVPFEVWDVGPVIPGEANDPSDDVRLIPYLFADNGGTCAFNPDEIPDGEATFGGFAESDRIYAYYPTTSYADFAALFEEAVANDPDGCVENEQQSDVFFGLGVRPIQRQVFGSPAASPKLPGTGTVIRMYTVDPPGSGPRNPVADEDAPEITALTLGVPHPNPGNATVQIPYALPASGEIELAVVDVLGRQVLELVNARQPEGAHTAYLDASALAPGVYVIRLRAGDETRTTRITVVR